MEDCKDALRCRLEGSISDLDNVSGRRIICLPWDKGNGMLQASSRSDIGMDYSSTRRYLKVV